MDQETVVVKTRVLPGRASLFRGKVRMPVSLTLTPDHHAKGEAEHAAARAVAVGLHRPAY